MEPVNHCLTTAISVVSHGQGHLVRELFQDMEQHWDTRRLSVILTLNVPETLPFDESRFSFPVLIVRNTRPHGFGANHNQAFGLSSASLFCVVNPDIRASHDPLPTLRRRLMSRERLALVAPRIYGPEGTIEDNARRLLTPRRILRRTILRKRERDYHIAGVPYLHPDWVAGMFMLIRAQAFADVGGFDERYFMYCEDADLCARLWQRWHGVELLPAGRVVHDAQRASHDSLKHLYWHITSLLRFFLTASARRPRLASVSQQPSTAPVQWHGVSGSHSFMARGTVAATSTDWAGKKTTHAAPLTASGSDTGRNSQDAGGQGDRRLRIALLAGSYDPRRDGVSVYIENLLVALLREQATDATPKVTVEVFCCATAIDTLRDVILDHLGNVGADTALSYHTVQGGGVLTRTALLSWQVARRGPYDAVVLPNLQPLLIPGRKLSILHDLTYQVARAHFSRRRHWYMDLLTRLRLRCDDAMGVISDTTRTHLKQYYPGARDKHLLYVPNGLPETKLGDRPSRDAIHTKLRKQPLELVFCGRLNRLKGVDRLLAFAELLDRQHADRTEPAPILHLVGKTTPETQLLLSGLSLERLVLRQHGFLSDEAVTRLYNDCGFALFLSRNEGFGLPVIEAIWNGVIPLVSDIPVFAEVLGAAYPRFDDKDLDLRAMRDFVARVRDDANYRDRILNKMEAALETHRDGYRRSARSILAFTAENTCGNRPH